MPQSKKRKPHTHHIDYIPHKKKRKSAVPVAIVFFALLSVGIAWFAVGPAIAGILIAAVIGIAVGYVAGLQMDKTFDKK